MPHTQALLLQGSSEACRKEEREGCCRKEGREEGKDAAGGKDAAAQHPAATSAGGSPSPQLLHPGASVAGPPCEQMASYVNLGAVRYITCARRDGSSGTARLRLIYRKEARRRAREGEEERAMPSASNETRRGRSSLVVPARLMGAISAAVIIPHLATALGTSIQRPPLGHSSVEQIPKAAGSVTFTGRGSLRSLAICDAITNTYSGNGSKKLVHLSALHSSCAPAHPWPLHAPELRCLEQWGGERSRKEKRKNPCQHDLRK